MMLKLDSFEMKEKDLGGYQAVLSFGEYELSVISGDGAYGSTNAPYEIGVFKNGDMIHMPGITDEDDSIKGWLTKSDIDAIISKMYFLTGTIPRQI